MDKKEINNKLVQRITVLLTITSLLMLTGEIVVENMHPFVGTAINILTVVYFMRSVASSLFVISDGEGGRLDFFVDAKVKELLHEYNK